MKYSFVERRKESRYPFLKTLSLATGTDSEEIVKGITIDISSSGMSLYLVAPKNLHKGQSILLKDPIPVPYKNGTILWVRKENKDFYKAGVVFH